MSGPINNLNVGNTNGNIPATKPAVAPKTAKALQFFNEKMAEQNRPSGLNGKLSAGRLRPFANQDTGEKVKTAKKDLFGIQNRPGKLKNMGPKGKLTQAQVAAFMPKQKGPGKLNPSILKKFQ